MGMYFGDTALHDGLHPLFFLLLICPQIQTNHIRKAKEGTVIHKAGKRRPGGGKKPFLFALHVNRGHFPIHSIFNYTEVEQEGQVSLRGGRLWKRCCCSTCAPGKSVLCPDCGREGRVVLIDQWGERRASRHFRHMLYLCRDTLYCASKIPTNQHMLTYASSAWSICWAKCRFSRIHVFFYAFAKGGTRAHACTVYASVCLKAHQRCRDG